MRPHVAWIKANIQLIPGETPRAKLITLGIASAGRKGTPTPVRYLAAILKSDSNGMRAEPDGKGARFFCAPDRAILLIKRKMTKYLESA